MCLITEQLEPEILEEDLKVFKILSNKDCSPFYYYKWIKGEMCETTLEVLHNVTIYHPKAFYADYIVESEYRRIKHNFPTIVTRGFHSYTSFGRTCSMGRYLNVKEFMIPKGATVYRDKTGVIVSDKIKFVGDVNH